MCGIVKISQRLTFAANATVLGRRNAGAAFEKFAEMVDVGKAALGGSVIDGVIVFGQEVLGQLQALLQNHLLRA